MKAAFAALLALTSAVATSAQSPAEQPEIGQPLASPTFAPPAVSVPPIPAPSAPVPANGTPLDAARLATREGRWSDARGLWEAFLQEHPDDAMAVAELGWADMELGRDSDARRQFNRAARLMPNLLRAQEGLVALAIREFRYDAAVQLAQRMVDANPKSAVAYRTLGDAQRAASRRSDAEAAYRRAVALDTKDARGHASLADTMLVRRRSEDAVKEFAEAVRLEPANGPYREGLARACLAAGQYGKASIAYADAIDLAVRPGPAPTDWARIDSLTLALLDALERTAAGLRSNGQTRQDVFEANTRAQAIADTVADVPAIKGSDSHTDLAFSQRALAMDLLGQAAAAELDALKSDGATGAADAVVFREASRRAVVAARAASRSGAA